MTTRLRCGCGRHAGGPATVGATPSAGRRALLGGGASLALLSGLGAVTGLAGCGDQASEAKALAPVEIGAATSCELDGMLLADYPGPKIGRAHV